MNCSLQSIRVQGCETNKHENAIVDIGTSIGQYAVCMTLTMGEFYLCEKEGRLIVVGVPTREWKGDVKNDGFKIIQRLVLPSSDPFPPKEENVDGMSRNQDTKGGT